MAPVVEDDVSECGVPADARELVDTEAELGAEDAGDESALLPTCKGTDPVVGVF